MATAQQIYIDSQNLGLWDKVKQTDEAAQKATELLQKDLETHHVYFNDRGFHNHIVHHILSLYGTGADATHLQKGFDVNDGYQRPPVAPHPRVAEDLRTWDHASQYLAKEQYYPDFLAYFQRAIAEQGWQAVVSEHLLSGTGAADDLLVRLHAGLLHPMIQLMYGMEWEQPAIVAAALAQTCVHKLDFEEALFAAERKANEEYGGAEEKKMPRIMELLQEARGHRSEFSAVEMGTFFDWDRKGVPAVVTDIISKVKIRPEELEERTVEMFDASMFTAAGATFHAPKVNKFDFFLIHHVNLSPIYLIINKQSWIPDETKVRLLEWKIRLDILQYAAKGVPSLSLDEIKAYEPRGSATAPVAEVISDLHPRQDEGHAIKLARSAVICQEVSRPYEDREWLMLKGDDTWMKIHHLIHDSVEGPGETWVWCAGQDEAWKDIPERLNL